MGLTYALVVLNMFTRYLSCGLAVSYDGNLVFAFGAIETDLFASFGCVTYAFNITKFMINLSLAIGLYILNAYLFAKKLDIEVPISSAIYEAVYTDITPQQLLDKLMNRKLKGE